MKINSIRCVNSIREQVNPRGLKQLITEYTTKDGKRGTEIITNLDAQGNKGIRTIERDIFDKVEKVTDDIYGRCEEYTRAFPIYNKGIFQSSKDGLKTYFPEKTLESLCRY